jgi:hypothetical protein
MQKIYLKKCLISIVLLSFLREPLQGREGEEGGDLISFLRGEDAENLDTWRNLIDDQDYKKIEGLLDRERDRGDEIDLANPFLYAVKTHDLKMVELFLKYNPPLNGSGRQKENLPLIAACDLCYQEKKNKYEGKEDASCEKAQILHLLLERGAQVDGRNKRGKTALMLAAKYRSFPQIEKLLQAGADATLAMPDFSPRIKNIPLNFVRVQRQTEIYEEGKKIVHALAGVKGSLFYKDREGRDILFQASMNQNDWEKAFILLEYAVKLPDENFDYPYLLGNIFAYQDIKSPQVKRFVEYLLAAKKGVEQRPFLLKERSAITYNQMEKTFSSLNWYVDFTGSEIYYCKNQLVSPLSMALMMGSTKKIKRLLSLEILSRSFCFSLEENLFPFIYFFILGMANKNTVVYKSEGEHNLGWERGNLTLLEEFKSSSYPISLNSGGGVPYYPIANMNGVLALNHLLEMGLEIQREAIVSHPSPTFWGSVEPVEDDQDPSVIKGVRKWERVYSSAPFYPNCPFNYEGFLKREFELATGLTAELQQEKEKKQAKVRVGYQELNSQDPTHRNIITEGHLNKLIYKDLKKLYEEMIQLVWDSHKRKPKSLFRSALKALPLKNPQVRDFILNGLDETPQNKIISLHPLGYLLEQEREEIKEKRRTKPLLEVALKALPLNSPSFSPEGAIWGHMDLSLLDLIIQRHPHGGVLLTHKEKLLNQFSMNLG